MISLETASGKYSDKFTDLEKNVLQKIPGVVKISVDMLNDAKKIGLKRFKVKNLYENFKDSQVKMNNLLNLNKSISSALLTKNINKLKSKMQNKLTSVKDEISKLKISSKTK